MDRRDFLRSAGTTAASDCLLAATGAAAARDRPQWNRHWRSCLSAPDAHPLIPNVSYAGYRRGELPLPRLGVRAAVTAFGAVGDGVTDCTAAFTAAIERVGAAGGGTVHVPPGTYLLTGVVWVHHSRVAIRGAGRGRTRLFFDRSLTECYRPATRNEWSWSGGLVWFIPRELRADLEASGFTGNETSAVTVVRSRLRSQPYPWATAARRLRPELTTWPPAVNFARYRFPVQVHRVERDAVVLAQPLKIDLRRGWSPRFATLGPVVAESGIEDLTIEMRQVPQTAHHLDPGFNGPHFQAALNCRARHHTFICRVQTHDLLVDHFEIPAATTPLAPGAAHHGINTEGFSSGNVWSNGTMEGTFDSHRVLPFESVRTAITITNNGTTGGAGDAGPRWGARFCHWNVDVLGGRSHGVRLEAHAPYSAMVGVRGTTGPTDHPADFTGELSSVADALDEAVHPVNLYEAQLRHRLRGTT
ncbi:glycosyl hydrolase family 28-related protein [Actinophytocola sp. KF-1]